MAQLATFGKYELLRLVRSEGEFIEQHVARQAGMARDVELRILTVPGGAESPLAQRFLHETRILAQLDHPSIVPVLDCGSVEGRLYFATPLRNAVRLEEYVAERGGRLPPDDVLRVAEILADALAQLHEEGLLHRGLSASTVYWDRDSETPYIGEGLALKDLRYSVTTASGLPALAELLPAPEGLSGEPLDQRTDVFLFCCLIYELLAGRPPFRLADFRGRAAAGAYPTPTPLAGLVPDGPLALHLGEVVARGLAQAPADRFADGGELATALRAVAERDKVRLLVQQAAATDGRSARPPSPRAARRGRAAAPAASGADPRRGPGAVGVAAAAAVALLALLVLRPSAPDAPVTDPAVPPATSTGPRRPAGAATDDDLLALARRASETPTTEQDFKERAEAFGRWLNAQSGARRVCSHLDLLQLRFRFFDRGDRDACRQLDEWLAASSRAVEGAAPAP